MSKRREALEHALRGFRADPDGQARSAIERLVRGVVRLELGDEAGARSDARAARSQLPLIAAHLLYAAGAFDEGLQALASLETSADVLSTRIRLSDQLGWNLETLEAIELALACDALNVAQRQAVHRQAARLYEGAFCEREALHHLDRASPGALAGHVLALASGMADDERLDTIRTSSHAESDERVELASELARYDLDAADELLRNDASPRAVAERAHIALARRDLAAARELAEQALPEALAQVVVGVLERDTPAGEARFEGALGSNEDALARSWLAETQWRRGDYETSRATLHQMRHGRGALAFVADVQRLLLSLRTRERASEVTEAHRFRDVREGIVRVLGPQVNTIMERGHQDEVDAMLVQVLDALGDDRRYGRGVPIRGARARARRALLRIQALGEGSLAAFDEDLGELAQNDALVRCHRGELLSWLGRYDEADQELQASIAIDPETRWAYIGLSALALVRDDAEACLQWNERGIRAMGGTVGAAVYVHRGEAYRRLGRYDDAARELELAASLHPWRISVTLNQALLGYARGDEDADERFLSFTRIAPGLVSDAQDETTSKVDLLERCLEMLGANRSSSVVTYHARAGLRFVPLRGASQDPRSSELDRIYRRLKVTPRA